jgi:LmbE family N-acetylglucosaminyl deacetylase
VTTVVSFHAHPDDEALLVGGTLARLAAEGHRVVIVVATRGEAGLDSSSAPARDRDLGTTRLLELHRAAAALGVDTVHVLGYADSGSDSGSRPGLAAQGTFSAAAPADVAEELARILLLEDADVLTTYDAAGGYGHPDHVQVHRVGARAAALARVPVVLEATLDRRSLARVLAPLRLLARLPGPLRMDHLPDLSHAYTAREEITHVVDVRGHLDAKRRALAAHATQGGDGRTVGLLLRLPRPLARRVLGREWFRQVGRSPGARPSGDVLDGLLGVRR